MTWYATHFKLKLGWKTHTKVHIYGIFTLWFTQQWVHFLLLLLNYALARFCGLSVFVCTFNIAKNILLLFSHVQWGKVSELICFTPKITCIVTLLYVGSSSKIQTLCHMTQVLLKLRFTMERLAGY